MSFYACHYLVKSFGIDYIELYTIMYMAMSACYYMLRYGFA